MDNLFPDAEAVSIKHLRTAGISAGRVYGDIPNGPTWPLVTLHRAGGTPAQENRLDRAQIQINAWAISKPEARLIAAQARQSIRALAGQRVSVTYEGQEVGGFVTAVTDVMGLTPIRDPDTGRYRYFFQVAIYLHR